MNQFVGRDPRGRLNRRPTAPATAMSHRVPCTNPNCTFVFPPDAVAAGEPLKCPRCGKPSQFQSRQADAVGPEPGRPVRPRILALSAFLVLAVLVAAGAYALRTGKIQQTVETSSAWLKQSLTDDEKGPRGGTYVSRDFNYRFALPGPPWRSDAALKVAVKANSVALVRTDPDVWFALAAKDYKQTNPDAGQLTDEILRRLGGYFKNFEWESKGQVSLAGRPARRIVFQGAVSNVPVTGECCLLANQGIGYWLTAWTTADAARRAPEQVAAEFDRLRQGFALGDDRAAWKEQAPTHTFRGRRAAYEFRDVIGPWKEWPNPESEDARADLLLMGIDPEDVGHVARHGSVSVLLLERQPAGPAALQAARAYVEAQRKKTYPASTAEVLASNEAAVGSFKDVVRLRVRDGESRERFVLLAVAAPPTVPELIAVQCECDWRRRARWEPAFRQLLEQFRLAEKAAR